MSKETSSFRSERTEDLLKGLNVYEQKNAPDRLYVAGDTSLLSLPSVSIIGSREASKEGIRRAQKLSRQLVEHGIVIVSGLAHGIDTAAHHAAMEEGGRTIAVLGTPLEDTYPRENRDLQLKIMASHLAVSQFPPGSPIRRTNFPQRNRTMALISNATVIVEAGETSGTLSQGWEALRLAHPLFIMNSVAQSGRFKWVQEMMRYGARVLTDVQDILDTLPPIMTQNEHEAAAIAI